MEAFNYTSQIYKRLFNIKDKTFQYYQCLNELLIRMGNQTEFVRYLVFKIEQRKKFGYEINLELNELMETKIRPNMVRRPVAVFWVAKDELMNVPCKRAALAMIKQADIKSYEEYGYLLKVNNIPSSIQNLAKRHRMRMDECLHASTSKVHTPKRFRMQRPSEPTRRQFFEDAEL